MNGNSFLTKFGRQTIRLKGFDYSQDGFYFVTICTHERENFFGILKNGFVCLNEIGVMVTRFWYEIPRHFPFVTLDALCVLPNHIHGILIIGKSDVGVQNFEPLRQNSTLSNCHHTYQHTLKHSLGSIIRAYKSSMTMWCRCNGYPYFRWQRLFYDHIIRNEESLDRIRDYIFFNTLKHSAS